MAFDTCTILLKGYIGQTVTEMKKDKKGQQYCRFSIAVTSAKHQSTWYQINVYGDLAHNLIKRQRIIKGHECVVKGVPAFNSYFDQKSQTMKANFGVFADWVSIQEKVITKEQQEDLAKANEIDSSIPDSSVEDLEIF